MDVCQTTRYWFILFFQGIAGNLAKQKLAIIYRKRNHLQQLIIKNIYKIGFNAIFYFTEEV